MKSIVVVNCAFLVILFASKCSSRTIIVKNNDFLDIVVSVTGFEDVLIVSGYNASEFTVSDSWNGTVLGRPVDCKEESCKTYASKAEFTMGYLASNLDLYSINLEDGFNLGIKITSSPATCNRAYCQNSYFLSDCPTSALVIANGMIAACKNNDKTISTFNINCGRNCVTMESKRDPNTYRCVNGRVYTVTFGN